MNREPAAHGGDEPVDSIDEPATLARAIACASPARLGRRSRAGELFYKASPELLYLLPRAGIALVAALLVATFVIAPHTRDEWDGVYEMSCNDFGILVWTAGEDGRPGTGDDIRSDQ